MMGTKTLISEHKKRERYILLLLVFPALLFYIVFFVYPVLGTFHLSLFIWNGMKTEMRFVGLKNFPFAFVEDKFLVGWFNNLFIAVFVTLFQNLISLGFALLFFKPKRLSEFYKTLVFLPSLISLVAAATLFSKLVDSNLGVINFMLRKIGLDGLAIAWLGTPIISLMVISVIGMWGGIGVTMMVYIAGLKSISPELLESAEIDGAGRFARFRYVTFPMLAPAFTVNFSVTFIANLKIFEIPWIVYRMMPPKLSSVASTVIVSTAFSLNQFGLSAAMAVMFFVLAMILGFVQIFFLRRRELKLY
jgi:raffinose/stachyose/melibiose transport system permease protein